LIGYANEQIALLSLPYGVSLLAVVCGIARGREMSILDACAAGMILLAIGLTMVAISAK
jgi:hypothetical protein